MLLPQEPTFVMVVTQEPATNIYKKREEKKEKLLPLMHFQSWNDLLLHTIIM